MVTTGEKTDRQEIPVPEERQLNAWSELLELFKAADMAPRIGPGEEPLVDNSLAIDTSPSPPELKVQADGKTTTFEIAPNEDEIDDAVPAPVYPSTDDVPTLDEGNIVYVSGEGLMVEDGS